MCYKCFASTEGSVAERERIIQDLQYQLVSFYLIGADLTTTKTFRLTQHFREES